MNRFRLCDCLILATVAAVLLCTSCAENPGKPLTSSTVATDADTPSAERTAVHDKKDAPLVISRGQEVLLEDYLVTGKTTIFEFTSRFDARCRNMSKNLDKLHSQRPEIAVVRIDINRPEIKGVDWSSPVCQQYQVHALPVFKVYDAAGKLIAEDKKAANLVERWVSH